MIKVKKSCKFYFFCHKFKNLTLCFVYIFLIYDGLIELGSQVLKTPREFLDYYFENDKVKAMFIP